MGQREPDRIILRGLIHMAHELGIRVTAEGVETREQAEILRSFGCNEIQGYLVSRPMPAAALAGLLEEPTFLPESEPFSVRDLVCRR